MASEKILAKKKEEVSNMIGLYKDAKVMIITDYLGLTVAQDTVLRAEFRDKKVEYKVQKNRLLLLALKEMGVDGAEKLLQGPTAVACSTMDYVVAAKLCAEAERKYKTFSIKGGIVDGKPITADEVKSLANLPSKEILIARVLGGFNAPISGLVNVLSANISSLARVLNAIAEKK